MTTRDLDAQGRAFEPVTVSFSLTEEEAVRGKQISMLSNKLIWGEIALFYVGAVLLALSPVGPRPVRLTLAFVLIAFWPYRFMVEPRRRYRTGSALRSARTLEVDSEGVLAHYSTRDVMRTWAAYRAVLERGDLYVLQYRDNSSIIPRRAFESSVDEQRFRTLAASQARVTWELGPH